MITRIDAYRTSHGLLPDTLRDVGFDDPDATVFYRQTAPEEYVLWFDFGQRSSGLVSIAERAKIVTMETPEIDTFWDELPALVGRDPEMVHGAPVVKDENGNLTRLPADTLVDNVEAFMEISGLSEAQAIEATLECFPGTPGGADTIRKLLAYQEARLTHRQPS